MDKLNRQILNILQFDFPLVPRPFSRVADKLKISESEVIALIKLLKKKKIIREISGLFNSRRLGFISTLVAFKVEPKLLDKVALVINSHPGVSHNYSRQDEWNLWFTLTAPRGISLRKEVEKLSNQYGVKDYMILPMLDAFKGDVRFDLGGGNVPKKKILDNSFEEDDIFNLTEEDKVYLSLLEEDLPIVSKPFELIAKRHNMSESDLLSKAHFYIENRLMKRFSASLDHLKIGFKTNAMVVWNAPLEKVEKVALKIIKFPQVGHCYQRAKYPNWDYSLYCTVHGKNHKECETTISSIAQKISVKDYKVLYSLKEYKKKRTKIFAISSL